MTAFADRPGTALVVIDVQNAVVAEACDRAGVIQRIAGLVSTARAERVPVLWIQHCDDEMPAGSQGWEIVSELQPTGDEPRVLKRYRSSFEETELERLLAERGIGRLVLCGAETTACVRHTTHAALERGYDVTLIGDAHTGTNWAWKGFAFDAQHAIEEMNLLYDGYQLPGRGCQVLPADQVFPARAIAAG
ncbi:MAG: isochorismatase family protein [Candidatus Nanopelagicales bacterium]